MYAAARIRKRRVRGGFTLLEAVIALAVFSLLAAGATRCWLYTTRAASRLLNTQEAFENARAAMDALTVNLQMAYEIKLKTDSDHVLEKLVLTELDDGEPSVYEFYFKRSARPGEAKYHRLEFGQNNEFASHIEQVRLMVTDNHTVTITVITDDELGQPITLTGMVDVRHKKVD